MAAPSLLPAMKDIEAALGGASSEQKLKMLMSVTDLFVAGQSAFGEAQVHLFDDVMVRMMERIESEALVELSIRLAPQDKAPPNTIQRLARHDSIGIAGPVLTNSGRLSDADLIEIARTKSQAHLTMIARRPKINEPVSDALVDHGDENVANEVARNAGAKISELTMGKLVMRAESDARLTESIFLRRDLSPRMFRQLVAQAAEAVRGKLMQAASPEQQAALRQVLQEISAQMAQRGDALRDYSKARLRIAAFSQDTEVTKSRLADFAAAGVVPETVVILSVLTGIPIEHLDSLVDAPTSQPVLILCRSLALPWKTAAAVLTAWHGAEPGAEDKRQYDGLSLASAQRVLHFWRGRQRSAQHFVRQP